MGTAGVKIRLGHFGDFLDQRHLGSPFCREVGLSLS